SPQAYPPRARPQPGPEETTRKVQATPEGTSFAMQGLASSSPCEAVLYSLFAPRNLPHMRAAISDEPLSRILSRALSAWRWMRQSSKYQPHFAIAVAARTSRHGNVSAIRANPERFPHNPGCCAVEGSLHRSIGATATSFCSRYMTRGSDKVRLDSVNRIT